MPCPLNDIESVAPAISMRTVPRAASRDTGVKATLKRRSFSGTMPAGSSGRPVTRNWSPVTLTFDTVPAPLPRFAIAMVAVLVLLIAVAGKEMVSPVRKGIWLPSGFRM